MSSKHKFGVRFSGQKFPEMVTDQDICTQTGCFYTADADKTRHQA